MGAWGAAGVEAGSVDMMAVSGEGMGYCDWEMVEKDSGDGGGR